MVLATKKKKKDTLLSGLVWLMYVGAVLAIFGFQSFQEGLKDRKFYTVLKDYMKRYFRTAIKYGQIRINQAI